MKNIIIGLIICAVGNNHIFGNVVLLAQDSTYTFKTTDEETAQKSSFNDTNGNTRIKVEPYTDFNNNGKYDYSEEYIDDNQNGIYDIQEPFIDKGNGIYDVGEEFVDVNGNNKCDLELWYVDNNRNGKWDDGEPFDDLNNNGLKDYKEPFTDLNNNNKYDTPERTGDIKFTFSAIAFSEPFIDIANGQYDLGEEYEDLNGDGKWTAAEEYEDLNGDGKWTAAEEYEDLNGDGKWTEGNEQNDPNDKSILNQQDVESLMNDTLKTSVQEDIMANQNDIIPNTPPYKKSFKSPGKALLYSSVLPGMGQAYMGNWLRALLFVSIDVASLGIWYHNNNLAEEKKKEYSYYANDHWNFGRWVHDYYKWAPEDKPDDFLGDEELWDSIREVFVNKSDTIRNCHEPPHCYTDIWEHSHSVEFTYDDDIKSTSSNEFKNIFKKLCGNEYTSDQKCSTDVIDLTDSKGDTIFVIKDHHFYEGIGKYNLYYSGWVDNDSLSIVIEKSGYKTASSPNKVSYHNYWKNYDHIKRLGVRGGNFMLINRVVSMLDAVLLAKKWNNKHDVKLSLNVYPDLRNKSGIGGVKLSLKLK